MAATRAGSAKNAYALTVYITKEQRERLHAIEAELFRDEDLHVSASEIIRMALELTLNTDKLKRELVKRRGESK